MKSNDNSLKVEYTKYENLLPFEKETNFLDLLRSVGTNLLKIEENEWRHNFNVITELRRILKYEKDLFWNICENYKIYSKVLPKFINSLRSNLAKNSLVLASEIFNFYENDENVNIIKCIEFLLPEVLLKSATDLKIFLKEEAMNCLKNLSENMFYGETIFALLKEIKSSNYKLSQNAFDTLVKLLQNYDKSALENLENWKEIILKIIEVHNMKKNHYIKKPQKIISTIEEKIGSEFFEKIITENLTDSKNIEILKNMKLKSIRKISTTKFGSIDNSNTNFTLKERIKDYCKEKSNMNNDNLINN